MTATSKLLLCADLDRTLLPNGAQPESASARARSFARRESSGARPVTIRVTPVLTPRAPMAW